MKFLCLAYLDRGLAPPAGVAAAYGALTQAMRQAGVFVDSGQLSPPDSAKVVRVTAGQAGVSDGPPPAAGHRLNPIRWDTPGCKCSRTISPAHPTATTSE